MKKTLKIYYSVLLVAIAAQAVFTISQLGQSVCYQNKINDLQKQKAALSTKAQKLDQQISHEASLHHNQLALVDDYQAIAQPLTISSQETVALR